MSKERSIDVWLPQEPFKHEDGDMWLAVTNHKMVNNGIKARLIIELPEKKIEISESQFDEAAKEISRLILRAAGKHQEDYFKTIIESIQTVKKQKLFGSDKEGK